MLTLSHKTLEVYSISFNVLKEIYLITKEFPAEEKFSLISQLRRSAISVCSNIAEGASRISKNEKKRFYEIARSSLVEMDTQLEISYSLAFCNPENLKSLEKNIESVFRILSKMISNL